MEPSNRVEQFVESVEYTDSSDWLEKSVVTAFTRILKTGKKVFVKEHQNKVVSHPKDDTSEKTIASLGAAAKERAKDAKPVRTVKEIVRGATTERLQQLRHKLGGTTHRVLLTSYKGRPLHYWLAAVDAELAERTAMAKSHHAETERHLKSGKVIKVKGYDDKRTLHGRAGNFRHKDTNKTFWYKPIGEKEGWLKERGATHEIELHSDIHGSGKRGAIIKQSVAHVIVDEDEHGNAVWEKWPLKQHHHYEHKEERR